METMSKPLKTSTDRFTSLPEHVAHEILKFLPLEDISRLSVVSRTCRQVCISMPSLKVNVVPYLYNATKRTQLMNYVDRLLSLRRGMDSHCLFIDWGLPSTEEVHRVLSLLHNAVVCNFKQLKLILRLKSGSEFRVPPSLLCSTSLESLTVKISTSALLKFPSYYSSINGFSSLESLTLCGVRIDESFSNWVSICCKFLRKLCLSQIKETKSLVINSSSMYQLFISSTYNNELCHLQVSAETLEYMTLRWEFDDSPNNRTLQLSSPKLQIFLWRGTVLSFPFTENMACLKSLRSITYTSHNLVRLYCDVCYLKSRSLGDILQITSKWGHLPILFTSSLSLHILTTSMSDELIQLVEFLFKGSSTAYRYLYICAKILHGHIETTEKEDHDQCRKWCDVRNGEFMQNLKFVTIEFISQGKTELEMIKYLLKNAKYLQMMTILYTPPLGSDVIGEIRGYEKASADAVVNFHSI